MIAIKKTRKGNRSICTRIIACLLMLGMLLPMIPLTSLPVMAADSMTEPSYTDYAAIELQKYGTTNQVVIYNYFAYTDTAGAITTGGTSGFAISGVNHTAGFSITVGDNETENPLTDITDSDINVQLSAAATSGSFIVKTVDGGNKAVNLYVKGNTASSIGTMTVEEYAKLNLYVFGELTLDTLSFADFSQVTISVQEGGKLTVYDLNGTGTLNVTGGKGEFSIGEGAIVSLTATDAVITVGESLHAATINLSGTTVKSSADATAKASVTASDSISIHDGSIEELSLFGYDASATGVHGITLTSTSGITVQNVDVFGVAEEAKAMVRIHGYGAINSMSGTYFVSDFDIRFYHNDEEKSYGDCVGYRAKYRGLDATVEELCGTLTSDCTIQSGEMTLPAFSEGGYTFEGWSIDNSEAYYFALSMDIVTVAKELELRTAVIAGEVQITFDHGFEPSEDSHVCPEGYGQTWEVNGADIKVGATISLDYAMSRFGYDFIGWQITTGEGTKEIVPTEKSYTIAYADITETEDGVKTLIIEAKWKIATFPFRLSVATELVSDENLRINLDGTNWLTLDEIPAQLEGVYVWDRTQKYFKFNQNIQYGESFADYFTRIGLAGPKLMDASEVSPYAFNSWTTLNGTIVRGSSTFSLGSMLDNRGDHSLTEYSDDLNGNPISIIPAFGNSKYLVNIDAVDGWDVFVGDDKQEPEGDIYTLELEKNTIVTLQTTPENAANASLWHVKLTSDDSKCYLTEQPYQSGDTYVSYTFSVPEGGATATYAGNLTNPFYFDLFLAPITMVENVTYNNILRNGFWYRYTDDSMPYMPLFAVVNGEYKAMSALTEADTVTDYFYAWNDSSFYVTTHNEATQNPLTLVNEITVYLKECNLVATDAYTADVIGRKIKGINIEGQSGETVFNKKFELAQYGNIVIDNSVLNSYTVNFVVEGENTVNGIFPVSFNHTADYNVKVIVKGDDRSTDVLQLGTIFGNFSIYWYDLTVKEITGAASEYLVYLNGLNEGQSPLYIYGCVIEAPNKRLHTYRGPITVDYNSSTYNSEARGSQITIGSGRSYSGTNLYGYSHLHVKGDLMSSYNTITMGGRSSCIIDGNLDVDYLHWNVNPSLAGKYLIVKGTICSLGGANISGNMVVIANNIVLTNQCKIFGNSRIIANQIINRPVMSPIVDANGVYHWTGTGNSYAIKLSANGDVEPFLTYSQNSATIREYLFQGNSKVFLLGYYQATEDGAYDDSITAISENNPIKSIIEAFEADNNSLTDEYLLEAVNTEAAKYTPETAPECIIIGNSLYDVENPDNQGRIRNVKISENAGIYAAGNLTFYNTTTISGNATIVAGGSVTGKRSLNVSGGTITADSVGNRNKWTITTKDADGISRLSTTTISGGTLNVNSLGSASADDLTTLIISDTPIINPRTESTVKVYQDVLVSYIYGDDFEISGSFTQEAISFTGIWNGAMSGMLTAEKTLPTISPSEGVWVMGNMQGDSVTNMTANGILDDTASTAVYTLKKLPLYAVMGSNSLVVKELKSGSTVKMDDTALAPNMTLASVQKGTEVTLTLGDADDAAFLILCYYDANNILHNVQPEISGTTVTFTMPAATVELYITKEFSLDLYQYPVTLTGTGFSVEGDGEVRADGVFVYKGDIRIWQSVTHPTYTNTTYLTNNRIRFLGTIETRTVTLYNINQAQVGTMSIEIGENVAASIKVDGYARTGSIHVPYSSSLTIEGKNEGGTDQLNIKRATINATYVMIANLKEGTADGLKKGVGNVTFCNLTIMRPHDAGTSGILVYATSDKYCQQVVFDHVTIAPDNLQMDKFTLSSQGSLTSSVLTVEFKNSSVKYQLNTSYTSPVFAVVKNLKLTNSTVIINGMGTEYGAYGLCSYTNTVTPTVVMDNSILTYEHRNSYDGKTYYENQRPANELALTMLNGSVFDADRRLRLASLNLESGTLTVDYLFCNDITVSGGTLEAAYIINSAYALYRGTNDADARQQTYEDFVNWATAASTTYRKETGTFTMTGGTVTVSAFIGGGYGATINIEGGTLNAPAVGSYPAIFGYASVIPYATEEPAYQYAIRPEKTSSVINISGGAVNISENGYLGGHNSTVTITGGNVILADGAVIGLTSSQRKNAEDDATSHGKTPAESIKVGVTIQNGATIVGEAASILAPYGSITVSGSATAVKVKDMLADYGSILIEDARGTHKITLHPHVPVGDAGVYVANTLSAMDLTITGSAIVYAGHAEVVIPEKKSESDNYHLTVHEGAWLYAPEYGASGVGANEETIVAHRINNVIQNIISFDVIVSVNYVLNHPHDEPDQVISNPNETSYKQIVSEDPEYLHFADISCSCYDFAGWYDNPNFEGERITKWDKANTKPVLLYAKWTPKKVKFQVIVDSASNVMDIVKSTNGMTNGVLTGDGENTPYVFTFDAVYELAYATQLQGGTGIHLENHLLLDISFNAMEVVANDAYHGSTIITTTTTITKEFVKAYEENGTIILRLINPMLQRKEITFSIGTGETVPLKATIPEIFDVSMYVDYNGDIAEAFHNIVAQAPGYTFEGWSSDIEHTEPDGSYDDNVNINTPETFYPVWTPNTYTLTFSAGEEGESAQITRDEDEPVGGESYEVDVQVTYDTEIDGGIIWPQDPEGIQLFAMGDSVPYAWKKGYVFTHWEFTYGDQTIKLEKIDGEWDDLILNIADFTMLEKILEPDNNTTESVITFEAVYEPVKVTYVYGGEHWKDSDVIKGDDGHYYSIPAPGAILMGYTSIADHDTAGYDIFCKDATETYAVYSTSSATYLANQAHAAYDYRNIFYYNGHTFYGWFMTKEAAEAAATVDDGIQTDGAVWVVPDYAHITVFAAWHANDYFLELHATSGNASDYHEDTKFGNSYTNEDGYDDPNDDKKPPVVQVTVDHKLTTESGTDAWVDVDNWPDRDDSMWYTYTDGENPNDSENKNNRFLLGYTFVPLDPSNRTSDCTVAYGLYASTVTKMINDRTLFKKGDTSFFIPDSYKIEDIHGDELGVPDYPDGYTIKMYAVYRERSLVFLESYQDMDGDTVEKELAAYPYSNYVDYRATYATMDHTHITGLGYSFIDWYFYDSVANPNTLYPYLADKAKYENNVEIYVGLAQDSGSYDIKVYAVYSPQVPVKDFTMTADGNPVGARTELKPEASIKYTLPASIQSGQMTYTITTNTELYFVTKDELDANRFNYDWGDGVHTANNTVAVKISLYDANGVLAKKISEDYPQGILEELWLTDANQERLDYVFDVSYHVSKGWSIRLDLYHSEVMTEDVIKTFTIRFGFVEESLKDQWVEFTNVAINLKPSLYTVTYDASLPESYSQLNITNANGYVQSSDGYTVTEELTYGENLHGVPAIEGYLNNNTWYRDGAVYGGALQKLDADAADNGIRLTTKWNFEYYTLTAETGVMAKWNISYTLPETLVKANIETMPLAIWNVINSSSITYDKLPYHAVVHFEQKTEEALYEEFFSVNGIRFDHSDAESFWADDDGKYYLTTGDVTARYVTVQDLYLENGTITIEESQYTQVPNAPLTWRGGYRIWMDETNNTVVVDSTTNTLILKGALSGRTIQLGNLWITANNSIALDATTTATLTMDGTSTLDMKNIHVPKGASLTMVGGDFTLSPSVGYAGIGGNPTESANGTIILEGGAFVLNLPASGVGAGIGSASEAAAGNPIVMTGCEVTVSQDSGNDRYTGAWIGGKGVTSVTLTSLLLNQHADSEPQVDSYAILGQTVTLEGCDVGLPNPIGSPIAAVNSLTIKDTTIVQSITAQILNRPIGCENGSIAITNSQVEIQAQRFWNGYALGTLYDGHLVIDATSTVTIANKRLLELGNGNLSIDASGYTQGTAPEKAFAGTYVLLGNKPLATTIDVNGDATLALDTQSDDISIRQITSTAGTLTLVGNAVSDTTDSTVKLTLINGITAVGDLVLKNLCDVTVTAFDGNVGSWGTGATKTQVVIEKTNVTAALVGALGAHNATFTAVSLNDSTVTGTLVQDHYRLEYKDTEGFNVASLALDLVFRTSQVDGGDNVSVNKPLTVPDGASTWYYQTKDGDMIALYQNETPDGYDGHGVLIPALADIATSYEKNGIIVVEIYLAGAVEVEALVKEGRLFEAFTGGTNRVTIPSNGVFTAYVKFTGANTVGRYMLAFTDGTLPAGAKLGLVVLKKTGSTYTGVEYYSYTATGGEDVLYLDAFQKMGYQNVSPSFFTETLGKEHVDEMLISFDFLSCEASGTSLTVKPCFVVGTRMDGDATFDCILNPKSNGVVSATQESVTVTVPASASSVYGGQSSYALVAALDIPLPYPASVSLEKDGVVINGTAFGGKLLFNGVESGTYQISIQGISGSFRLTWSLAVQGDAKNTGVSLVTSNSVVYTLSVESPFLRITDAPEQRSYEKGEANTITVTYETSVTDDMVYAVLQKQNVNGAFGNETVLVATGGQVETSLATLGKGVYRICISLNGAAFDDCDNVYYTFIIH